jgi:hypothetical protein
MLQWNVQSDMLQWKVQTLKMYEFIIITVEFTRTILRYSHLNEKCGKYGDQTVQEGARLYMNWNTFFKEY